MKVLLTHNSNFMLDRLQQMLVSMQDMELNKGFHNVTYALTTMHKLEPELALQGNKTYKSKGLNIINNIRKESIKVELMFRTFSAQIYTGSCLF